MQYVFFILLLYLYIAMYKTILHFTIFTNNIKMRHFLIEIIHRLHAG